MPRSPGTAHIASPQHLIPPGSRSCTTPRCAAYRTNVVIWSRPQVRSAPLVHLRAHTIPARNRLAAEEQRRIDEEHGIDQQNRRNRERYRAELVEWENYPTEEWVACRPCDGDGIKTCHSCQGTGRSGKCSACHGKGEAKCTSCNVRLRLRLLTHSSRVRAARPKSSASQPDPIRPRTSALPTTTRPLNSPTRPRWCRSSARSNCLSSRLAAIFSLVQNRQ